jgi:hypothetical protein
MNNKIFIGILWVFGIILIVNSLISAQSVTHEQSQTYDQIRIDNIAIIQSGINSYYTNNTKLPQKLSDLNKRLPIQDPQTRHQYTYNIISDTSYSICATFATDTSKNKTEKNIITGKSVIHKNGYDCIQTNLQPSTATQTEKLSIGPFEKNTKLCPGQAYPITWNAAGKINKASLNLIHTATPSSNLIIAASIPFNYSEKEMLTEGKYEWTTGYLLNEIKNLEVDNGYAFELTVSFNKGDKYAVSEPFAIQDISKCLSFITPTITPIMTNVPTIFNSTPSLNP